VESIGQLEKSLKAAKKDQESAEKRKVAGWKVLAQTIDQKNKLEEEKVKQFEDIESLKAQLSDALKENNKLKGGIFGMTVEPSGVLILSDNSEFYECCSYRCIVRAS